MIDYTELVKLRMLSNNFSKPDELYPLLMKEMQEAKSLEVIPWLIDNVSGETVIDLGGGSGYIIKDLNIPSKSVFDKREFETFDNVTYYYYDIEKLLAGDEKIKSDVVVLSEVLHLFSEVDIFSLLCKIKAKTLVVVENKFDDFLDLRLRLWSKGRCLDKTLLSEMIGESPTHETDNYYIWKVTNG